MVLQRFYFYLLQNFILFLNVLFFWKYMLNHWTKRKHATVGVLIKALKNMNRLDIVKIVQSDITEIKNDHRLQHIV
jgi:hypothetical protein